MVTCGAADTHGWAAGGVGCWRAFKGLFEHAVGPEMNSSSCRLRILPAHPTAEYKAGGAEQQQEQPQ